MAVPVTLSALADSVATGAASAIGAEIGKDVYLAVSQGMSYCPCRSLEEEMFQLLQEAPPQNHPLPTMKGEAKKLVLKSWH